MSPQATQDFNHFLEDMPQHTGNTVLIIAGIIWASAGGLGLYTFIQSKGLAQQRNELRELEAVKPNVPRITNVSESTTRVKEFVEKIKGTYADLDISAQGASINIKADDTRFFPEFREAIGHVQNGGRGWRVNIDNICVGRQCKEKPLAIQLKVNIVSIETSG